jgi:ZIP family zinc transporter
MSTSRLVAGALVPLGLLALLIVLFTTTNAGLDLASPAPVEELTIERFVLAPGLISAHVRNTGPAELRVALVSVNDSIWPASSSPSDVIPRLGSARIDLRFPWVEGEAYHVAIFTENSIVFSGDIPVAFATPQPTLPMLGSFALIGLYVGVVPIALGLAWLPVLRQAGRRAVLFLTALTAGVLVILGVETLAEAVEQGQALPGSFQGQAVVGLGAVGMFLLLRAVSRPGADGESRASERRFALSYLIALGIGLHNLGEGLAIGAAYALGEAALGAFLVIGFIIQNVTEGIAIVVPILRERIRILHLVALAALAGLPTIAGTLIGGLTYSPLLATLFLALGAGAIFEVLWEVGRLALRESERLRAPFTALAGVAAGMLVLYLTGLLVA